MESTPIISVIVPVYNVKNYINRCIDSILNQSFSNFELILVDDGSTDGSENICEEYALKDSRIKVIHQKNAGQAAARNNGVKAAKGEWIAFIDSDDSVNSQLLKALYDAVILNNVRLSSCTAFEGECEPSDFYNDKKIQTVVSETDEQSIFNLCANEKYYYWVVWGKLIHKSILLKYPFTEGRIFEDNAVVCKWLYEAEKIAIIDSPLYFYFINNNGTTKKTFNEKLLDVLWAFSEQIKFYNTLNYKKMTSHILARYFEISAVMYYRAKHEGGEEFIKKIKADKKRIKTTYHGKYSLTTEQKLFIYERTNKFMFFVTRVNRKLKIFFGGTKK